MNRIAITVAALGGAVMTTALVLHRKESSMTTSPKTTPPANPPRSTSTRDRRRGGSRFPTPIAVGSPSDPEVSGLLEEMDEYFRSEGIDTGLVSAAEVTQMPKAPGKPSAVPPREYWSRMAMTLREVFMPLRASLGVPLAVRGYRPTDYNEAVGGAKGSRHQAFEALDIRISGDANTSAKRRELVDHAARIYSDRGRELKMGFGVYGKLPAPQHIHVDTGHQRRTWGDASKAVDQLGNV